MDKILEGTKPAEWPVEQPMAFDFVLKTAQALGLTFPNEILLQVTEVIQGRRRSRRAMGRSGAARGY